tara:strand:- start:398 stop:1732 length:1335 start_codon:yes stop_codon:yes gene_type:complete
MVTVHQHWDPLKVCAVGRCYPPHFYSRIKNKKVRSVMERIAIETEEDFQKLISKLQEFGVTVLRTDISDDPEVYVNDKIQQKKGEGHVTKYPPMFPRDYTGMVGNTFFMPSRNYGQNIDVRSVFNKLTTGQMKDMTYREKLMAKMLEEMIEPDKNLSTSMSLFKFRTNKKYHSPSKTLMGLDFDKIRDEIIKAETMQIGAANKVHNFGEFYPYASIENWCKENNVPIKYDQYINTASIIRCGKDLYFSFVHVINKLNQKHFDDKMRRLFPDYRLNYLENTGHCDAVTCAIKPGLVVSLKGTEDCQKLFPDWDVCSIPGESWGKIDGFLKMKEKNKGKYFIAGEEDNDELIEYIDSWLGHWVTYVEESVFDVNMLVIDQNNVICNSYNEKVFKYFEKHNVTPHIVNFRHRYFWDGGLHCITSDISREGQQNDYFPDRNYTTNLIE